MVLGLTKPRFVKRLLAGKSKSNVPTEPQPQPDSPLEVVQELRRQGNVFSNQARHAEAIAYYDQALVAIDDALKLQTDDPEYQETVSQTKLQLHLNLALTHIRRGARYGLSLQEIVMPAFVGQWKQSLVDAIKHSDCALAMDPENEKGYLRRGCARSKLCEAAEYEDLAESAAADLQKSIDINSDNQEAIRQLKIRKDSDAKRQMHKDLERLIRPDEEKYRPLLSVEHLHYFVDDKPVLSEVNLDLRAGRCLGILGGDGSGKSSLAQIFTGHLMPAYGQVRHHGKSIKPPGASVSTTAWVMVATVCALIYTSALVGRDPFSAVESLNKIITDIGALLVGFSFLFFFFVVKTFIDHYYVYDMEHTVKYLTSTSKRLDAKELAPKDIYKTFGAAVPRDRVNAVLKAAGLDQDTACEEASLVDLLRSLAVGTDALICEDILRDLTAMQQARVIHMLRRLKEERGTAILYISTDVAQLRLIADSIGHLHQGCLVELGPPEDMLDSPLNSSTQDLLANCKVNQKVLEHYAALAKDKDIAGDWLPA